ncbi:MAG: zinc-dependent metalloprotease [Prevotella sp.]|nr:zinc-dependent metalloprotease [Prevotella sp.]
MQKKYFLQLLQMLLCVAACLPMKVFAQGNAAPLTYEQFISQPGVVKHEAYFNIYQKDDRFCLEIPFSALGRDVLVSAQVVEGYGSFVSPASDVVRFERHNNQMLYMRRNRSLDVQADSIDISMNDAIRGSMMLPIDKSFTVMTLGEKGDSYIVDISGDVNQSSGLFDVSKNGALSHPDPSRSGVTGIRAINNGVAINVYRSQTDNMAQGSMDNMQDVAQTLGLEFIIQLLPSKNMAAIAESAAFGFQTITRQEFDMKNYGARRRNYICRWNFSGEPVTVFIDPVAPAIFQQSVRNAVAQWQQALVKAGVKEPFRITSDVAERSLSYGHILFCWGNAASGPNSNKIIDPMTGEIMAARVNFTDMSVDEDLLESYYILARHIDKRIAKDMNNIEVRRDILTAQLVAEIGNVLGMKANWRAKTAFTPSQLCSPSWLHQHGMAASATSPLQFNYLPSAKSGVKAAALLPCVSDYDMAAMKFAYGKGKKQPATKNQYFSAEDKGDPYTIKGTLSTDILEACRLGMENLKESYAHLHKDFGSLPKEQNSFTKESHVAVGHVGKMEQYLNQIASLVGGRSKYPIIRGVSEQATVYVPRQQQLAALSYLENNILNGIPQWLLRPEITKICSGNMKSMSIGTANGVLKKLMSADVLQTLAEQERHEGSNAYTAAELTDFINRVVFADFDKTLPVSDFKRKTQIALLLNVAEYVASHNIVMGMQNEGNCLLQVWLVDTAKKVARLAEEHADQDSREHFSLLKMRLDKMYFNKNIQ